LCVSDRLRSRFEPAAAGGNVGRGHPRATSSVGCRCCVERASSGVGRPPQGGRWASALRSGLRRQRGLSSRRRRLRSRVASELASDRRHRWREGGNTFEQLGSVSSLRTSERWTIPAVGWVAPSCSVFGRGGEEWIRCTVSGRAPRHDAPGVAPSPVLHAFSQVVSAQRSRRVTVGGNVDDSGRWVERMAARIRRVPVGASVRREFFGARAGVLLRSLWHSCRSGDSAQAGPRGEQAVASGGFQRAVRVFCDPSRSAGKAELA
jgi:hypothetical protein